MNRLLLASVPLAFLVACGPAPRRTCQETGCSAGSSCNVTSGNCEVTMLGGGGGTTGGGGGSTGGGGGTTGGGGGSTGGGSGGGGGSVTGGGGGGDAGVDAGPVIDPFDDGGVFEPGDICTYAIALDFEDGGAVTDGGAVLTVRAEMATATDQYTASCGNSSGTSGNDLVYALTLTQPQSLLVTAANVSADAQDSVLSLLASPCAAFNTRVCSDTGGSTTPEELRVDRLPAGTWYVLLDNYSPTQTPGSYDVTFELADAVPVPGNDTCANATDLTFTADVATVSGSTRGGTSDDALSCSTGSATSSDVFYRFTLTQPQDVLVEISSVTDLSPVVALRSACGGNELACDGSPISLRKLNLQPGSYVVVVDGSNGRTGDFTMTVTLSTATLPPSNDTCAMPTTLVPGMSQTVNANDASRDYTFSCQGNSQGGDAVYQFTTTQPQRITVAVTSTNADPVVSLRSTTCIDDSGELDCADDGASGTTETVTALNAPAGTYYVVVAAYGSTPPGTLGVTLTLDAPVLPPPNETCAMPATLMPGVTQMVDLSGAAADLTFDCSFSRHDAVYTFTTTQPQRVTLSATGGMTTNAILELRSGMCDTGMVAACRDDTFEGDTEVVTVNNLPAGTYYVVLGTDSSNGQLGLSLTLSTPLPPPTNETCAMPEVVTLTSGTAMVSADLSLAQVDLTADCAMSADGADLVYQVTVPAMQTLTVDATSTGDLVLAATAPMCAMATSVDCADSGSSGTESITVPNTTASPMTVYVLVKEYSAGSEEPFTMTFTAM